MNKIIWEEVYKMLFEEIKPQTEETKDDVFKEISHDQETKEVQNISLNDDNIQIPEWDLTPPFDSIDRSEM